MDNLLIRTGNQASDVWIHCEIHNHLSVCFHHGVVHNGEQRIWGTWSRVWDADPSCSLHLQLYHVSNADSWVDNGSPMPQVALWDFKSWLICSRTVSRPFCISLGKIKPHMWYTPSKTGHGPEAQSKSLVDRMLRSKSSQCAWGRKWFYFPSMGLLTTSFSSLFDLDQENLS